MTGNLMLKHNQQSAEFEFEPTEIHEIILSQQDAGYPISKITITNQRLVDAEQVSALQIFSNSLHRLRDISAIEVSIRAFIRDEAQLKSILKVFSGNRNISKLKLNLDFSGFSLDVVQAHRARLRTPNNQSEWRPTLQTVINCQSAMMQYLTLSPLDSCELSVCEYPDSIPGILKKRRRQANAANLVVPGAFVIQHHDFNIISEFRVLKQLLKQGQALSLDDNLLQQLRQTGLAELEDVADEIDTLINRLNDYHSRIANINQVYQQFDRVYQAIDTSHSTESAAIALTFADELTKRRLLKAALALVVCLYIAARIYTSVSFFTYNPVRDHFAPGHWEFINGNSAGPMLDEPIARWIPGHFYDPVEDFRWLMFIMTVVPGSVFFAITCASLVIAIKHSKLAQAFGQRTWQLLKSVVKREEEFANEAIIQEADCADNEGLSATEKATRFDANLDILLERDNQEIASTYGLFSPG